jgi:uncharacterized protein YjbI with pentapeptide repeats
MIQIKNRYTKKVLLEFESLIGANLRGANLINADLSGADLNCADLKGADLNCADLRDSDLRGANLSGVGLSGADLNCADLKGAINYYSFVAYDTSKRLVHCVKHDTTWMIKAGCFWGTLEELEIKVLDTHKSSVYLANIEILKTI